MMKAWLATFRCSPFSTVIFAESRGKAKSTALCTDACEDATFLDVRVHRKPQLDKYYAEGKIEMDWMDPTDRLALVKECGFFCDIEYISLHTNECERCSAQLYCDAHKEILGGNLNGLD